MNNSLITLDCEDIETTLISLENIYKIKRGDIKFFLINLNLDEYYKTDNRLPPGDIVTLTLFEKNFGLLKNKIDYVYWFHLTRTFKKNTFPEGIKPLGDVLDDIWNLVLNIFKDSKYYKNILELKNAHVIDFQYDMKTKDSLHWGPFAILIKEIAFKAKEAGNHDYLKTPEIIKDICNGYYEKYKETIYDEVTNSLFPCIVKFKSSKRTGRDCIEAAMYYLYCKFHNEDLSRNSNTCFDAENSVIPPENILKIEFL